MAMKFEPVVKSIYKKHDHHEYGGAPLLGANGILIKCHGTAEARTIAAAIRNSLQFARLNVNQAIVDALSKLEESANRRSRRPVQRVAPADGSISGAGPCGRIARHRFPRIPF